MKWSAIIAMVGGLGLAVAAQAQNGARVLAKFDDVNAWQLITSNQVSGALRPVMAGSGRALCLDYDFHDVSGYVGIRRPLEMTWPENYQVSFMLRGDSPANDLQFKLIDASGDNVWWVNRPGYVFPKDWTQVSYRKRHIEKAWGPGQDKTLRRTAAVEFTLYSKVGGKGTVCFDRLTMQVLPKEDTSALTTSVIADTATALQQRIADGKPDTVWISGGVKQQTISLDLGKVREFGGAVIQWVPGLEASRYVVQASRDGRDWQKIREVVAGAADATGWPCRRRRRAICVSTWSMVPVGATASAISASSRWRSRPRPTISSARWRRSCREGRCRAVSVASSRTGPCWAWTGATSRP